MPRSPITRACVGRLGSLDSDAPIGVTDSGPERGGTGALGAARKQNRHKAIVCLTRGGRPGLCPSNAGLLSCSRLDRQHCNYPTNMRMAPGAGPTRRRCNGVCGRQAHARDSLQRHHDCGGQRSFSAAARDHDAAKWLVLVRERARRWHCLLARADLETSAKPSRLATSSLSRPPRSPRTWPISESMHLCDRRQGIRVAERCHGCTWARTSAPGSIRPLRRTPDQRIRQPRQSRRRACPRRGATPFSRLTMRMQRMLEQALATHNLPVGVRMPHDRVPGGEAEVVHRGGGRYVSVIGSNLLFHNPADRGSAASDARVIARFADGVCRALPTDLAGELCIRSLIGGSNSVFNRWL